MISRRDIGNSDKKDIKAGYLVAVDLLLDFALAPD
jgi:hypothetical protein